ncbi:ATP-binding cassette domain-containing protein [Conexibacter woesei]|nr:ATP-binding cassette domain-containing protein [Conexibacter woesei]
MEGKLPYTKPAPAATDGASATTGAATTGATAAATSAPPLLSAHGLVKRYGHVTALNDVSAELHAGEIVAVVGDNGAGKSTFVSILSGVQAPDEGGLRLDGRPIALDSPQAAYDLGIATVFQDLALVDRRDVASNLFLGREPRRFGVVTDRKRMVKEARTVIDRMRVGLPSVHALAGDLSGGQRQAVAIARAVMRGSRVILLDEPTAALGVRESRRVVELMGELRAEGHGVLVISHNIESVLRFSDRIMVFRLGRKIADLVTERTTRQEVVELIVAGEAGGQP